jgi:competence protein ComEC
MSYAAVGALVAAHEVFHRWRSARGGDHAEERGPVWRAAAGTVTFFGGIAISTVIASLAVAPFGAYYFHKSQQYAILGNVLGLPICDVYIMPLALATLLAMPFGLEGGPLWLMGLGIDLLVLCAKSVASLPGAVASVQAIPDLSFLGMVAGGIWLGLWGSRWRMLGLIPIAAGLALAPFATKPDLLIGQDGKAIAVRLPTGNLSALPTKGRNFELARWLEYDGDSRLPTDVSTGAGFRCDAVGCTATLNGSVIAIAHSPAAYADDCRTARILIALGPRPDKCRGPIQVIDIHALRDQGTHAISLGKEGEVAVSTVAAKRGSRPWSASGLGAALASRLGRPLGQNSTPRGITERRQLPAFAPPAVFDRNGPRGANAAEDESLPLGDAIPDVGDQ